MLSVRSKALIRSNAAKYKGIKQEADFTDAEITTLVSEYSDPSTPATIHELARKHKTYQQVIKRILESRGVTLRDKAQATRVAHLTQVPPDDVVKIIDLRRKASYSIQQISEMTGYTFTVVKRILSENLLFEGSQTQELDDEDKKKLIKAKMDANARNKPFVFHNISDRLNLKRSDIPNVVIIRLFAEHNLNSPSDYSGSLPLDKQSRILDYFKDGTQSLSIKEICEIEGVSKSTVSLFLFYNNIIPKSPKFYKEKKLTQKEIDDIISQLKSGATNTQIEINTGISKHRLDKFIKEYRASQGMTAPRLSESKRGQKSLLFSQDSMILDYISQARGQTPPLSYRQITEDLNKMFKSHKGWEDFTLSETRVRLIDRDLKRAPRK